MAFTNPRGLPIADMGYPAPTMLMACTLADYTVAGTTTPVVGDLVTFSTTANFYVKRAPDNQTKWLGVVQKIDTAPSGTALGYIVVEWVDIIRFVSVPVAVLANVTLGNSLIKNGDTATAADWDAAATTGSIIAIAKSAATGAGTALGAVTTT
jgi:hypothetical protein